MICEAILVLASYHYDRNANSNEQNPGLGISVRHEDTPNIGAFSVVYYDSKKTVASMAGIEFRTNTYAGLCGGFGMGYGSTGSYDGPVAIPFVMYDFGKVSASVSALGFRALGLTLRYEIPQ